jgi:long-chain acyl-CoA synthetase
MTRDPLLRAFDRLVARAPETPLLVSPSHRVTAAEVDALARAAARAVAGGAWDPRHPARAAVPPAGEAVGLQAANGPGFLAGLVALRRGGHPAVLLDRRTPELERRRIATEVGAHSVLVCRCPWARAAGDYHLDAVAPPPGREEGSPPAGTAVVKLSSGSTGAARGIATTMEALIADDAALTPTMGIRPADRLLATVPFSHSYGLSSLVLPALLRGTLLVLPESDGPFGPLAAAADAGATVFPTVPAYLAALNRLAEPPPLPPSLRLVMTAGALLPAVTSARFRETYGAGVHVFYGASETGGICYDREGGAAERGTVGEPVAGVDVELAPLDPGEAGTEGAAARVVVRGPSLALAYLPPEPHRLDGGRYVTDDLGEWRGGELALVGRLNDLINVKGRKVNPREVERVLASLPAVDEALVTATPATAERGPRVRAVVACRPGSLTAHEVVAWCRRHLADHKVPRSVLLLEAVPRNERGKVDRDALAAAARAAADAGPPVRRGRVRGPD